MVNRHQWAALARGALSVLVGALILGAIGYWLGWWFVGAIAIAGIGYTCRWAVRLPWTWGRP